MTDALTIVDPAAVAPTFTEFTDELDPLESVLITVAVLAFPPLCFCLSLSKCSILIPIYFSVLAVSFLLFSTSSIYNFEQLQGPAYCIHLSISSNSYNK